MLVRNTSDQAQHFANIGTFEAGETRDFPEETVEYLLRSPHIVLVATENKKTKTLRGVESEK